MRLVCVLFLALPLFAGEITGSVINASRNQPGRVDTLQLLDLGQGMQQLAQISNVSGDFTLTFEGNPTGDLLIHASSEGVLYSKKIKAGDQDVQLEVFDKAADIPIKAAISSVAIYAYEDKMDVAIFYNLDNESQPPKVLSKPDTFSLPLASGFQSVDVSTRRQGSMPLRQTVTTEGNVATFTYDLKPGRTQAIATTSHPFVDGGTLTLPIAFGEENFHILSLPGTIQLEAAGISFISHDPSQDVNLYQYANQDGSQSLEINISGKPAPKRAQAQNSGSGSNGETKDQSGQSGAHRDIKNMPNAIDRWRWAIVGSIVALLAIMGTVALTKR